MNYILNLFKKEINDYNITNSSIVNSPIIIKQKYPDRLPFLIYKHIDSTKHAELKKLPKNKFLIRKDLSIQHVKYTIKNILKLPRTSNLIIECSGKILNDCDIIESIYNENMDNDQYTRLYYYLSD